MFRSLRSVTRKSVRILGQHDEWESFSFCFREAEDGRVHQMAERDVAIDRRKGLRLKRRSSKSDWYLHEKICLDAYFYNNNVIYRVQDAKNFFRSLPT